MKTSLEIINFAAQIRKNFIAGKNVRRAVWAIALPVMLANVTVPLVGLVDTAVMGHFEHAYYIAGVAMGAFIFSLITTIFGFQRMATTGLIAQAAGAMATGGDDKAAIFLTIYRGVVIALGLGLGIIVLSAPIITAARMVLAASDAVLDGMDIYVSIMAWAGPAICLNMVGLGALFGLQRVRLCMIQLITINSVNIIANIVFVFGFGLKIEGVAMASVLAQYIGLGVTIALARVVLGPCRQWRRFLWRESIAFGAIRRYISLGRDLTLRTIAIILGEILVLNASAGLGDHVIAASQLGFVIFGMMAYSLDGFAHAVEVLVGTAIGKRDPRALNNAITQSTILAGLAGLLMAAVILMFGGAFMRLLTSIPEVLVAADGILIWIAVMPLTSFWAFQMDGIFIGATRAKTMRNAMMVSILVFVPALFFGRHVAGLDGIWIAFNLLLLMRGVTLWLKIDELRADAR